MTKHNNPSLYRPGTTRFNDKGVFFACGMGCSRHDNCFTCKLHDCEFLTEGKSKEDFVYLTCVGDGIRIGTEYEDDTIN